MCRCDGLYRRLRRPGDTPLDEKHRRILLPVTVLFFFLAFVGVANRYMLGTWAGPYSVGCAIVFVASGVGAGLIFFRANVDYVKMLNGLSLPYLFGILTIDLANHSAMSLRIWPCVVILMDFMVVLNTPLVYQYWVMGITLFYLAVMGVESVVLFGAFDLGQEGGNVAEACMCPNPPCADGPTGAFLTWSIGACVFVLDYFVTRGFAVGLRHQLVLVDASVRVCERVAELLAAYATDDARRVVDGEEGAALPEAIRESYQKLLDNLDSYRVYLPDSLLAAQKQQQQQQNEHWDPTPGGPGPRHSAAPPPGLGEASPEVAMCFTDIQSSTALWEAHPQGMYEGLNLHNKVMRDAYSANFGYEVKTIGDSFMVAFESVTDAVRFGLAAQQGLLRQPWPDDLLQHPLCERINGPDGEPLWGGLRVRIGIHHGPVRVESNPVTGRCDYFGPTVNTAARLEAVLGKGGMVAVSASVADALGVDGLQELGSPELHDAGARELKGVREPVKVWALVPQGLGGRAEILAPRTASPGAAVVLSSASSASSAVAVGRSQLTRATDSDGGSSHGSTHGDQPRGSVWSQSSTGSRSASVAPRRVRTTRKIVLSMRQSEGSCVAARIALLVPGQQEAYPGFVGAAALAADQTQGVVDSVLSACVSVSWNTSRHCADHASAARQFIASTFRAKCHLGAAAGGMLHGSIAAGRRSFTTVVGGCVELAAALAEEAERCDDHCLATGAVADACDAGAAHWAQLWQPPSGIPLAVLEVETAGEEEDKWNFGGGDDDNTQGGGTQWADCLAGLFRRACTAAPGSPDMEAVLEELNSMQGGSGGRDQRALRLAARIQRGGVRTRPMPPLWEPGALRRSIAAGRRSMMLGDM